MSEQTNPEENAPEKTEDELLAEMIAEEEAQGEASTEDTQQEVLPTEENGENEDPETNGSEEAEDDGSVPDVEAEETTEVAPPEVPTPEETPAPPAAPAAVDPTAVDTTPSGLKFGWQQAPTREPAKAEYCSHIGRVVATQQIPNQVVGDEWVCTCGTKFEVQLNTGGKKVLKQVA